jgi:hypothetical protein
MRQRPLQKHEAQIQKKQGYQTNTVEAVADSMSSMDLRKIEENKIECVHANDVFKV